MTKVIRDPGSLVQVDREKVRHCLGSSGRLARWLRGLIGRSTFDPRVMAAMARVLRDVFVSKALRHATDGDGPLPIGHAQTISQSCNPLYDIETMVGNGCQAPFDGVIVIAAARGRVDAAFRASVPAARW